MQRKPGSHPDFHYWARQKQVTHWCGQFFDKPSDKLCSSESWHAAAIHNGAKTAVRTFNIPPLFFTFEISGSLVPRVAGTSQPYHHARLYYGHADTTVWLGLPIREDVLCTCRSDVASPITNAWIAGGGTGLNVDSAPPDSKVFAVATATLAEALDLCVPIVGRQQDSAVSAKQQLVQSPVACLQVITWWHFLAALMCFFYLSSSQYVSSLQCSSFSNNLFSDQPKDLFLLYFSSK